MKIRFSGFAFPCKKNVMVAEKTTAVFLLSKSVESVKKARTVARSERGGRGH